MGIPSRDRCLLIACALATITATSACEDRAAVGVAVGLQPTAGVAIQLEPRPLVRQTQPMLNCGAVPPFTTSFHVVVRASGFDLRLSGVTVQLIDGSSVGGPTIPFPSADLDRSFGSTVVFAGTSRAFPFNVHFGCLEFAAASLSTDVTVVDSRGNPFRTTATERFQ